MLERYDLVRIFLLDKSEEIIAKRIRREQVIGYLKNPNSQSKTANDFTMRAVTGKKGDWIVVPRKAA